MDKPSPEMQHVQSSEHQVPSTSRRKWLSVAGMTIASLLVLTAVLLPTLGRLRTHVTSGTCSHNMRQIALAAIMYAHDNKGIFPDTPEQLILTQDITSHVFVCPSTEHTPADGKTPAEIAANLTAGGHLSYIYCGKGIPSDAMKNPDENYILVTEPLTNHEGDGINVAFSDGHVEWFNTSKARDILELVNSGVRPVRWPAGANDSEDAIESQAHRR